MVDEPFWPTRFSKQDFYLRPLERSWSWVVHYKSKMHDEILELSVPSRNAYSIEGVDIMLRICKEFDCLDSRASSTTNKPTCSRKEDRSKFATNSELGTQ